MQLGAGCCSDGTRRPAAGSDRACVSLSLASVPPYRLQPGLNRTIGPCGRQSFYVQSNARDASEFIRSHTGQRKIGMAASTSDSDEDFEF
eukprot:SAG11_NODE_10715_length_810_cov_1.232068_1_plen_89_part_10